MNNIQPNQTQIEPGKQYGFFTDTTVCIGCKACEVACKEWNALPAEEGELTGMSYDNTQDLGATTWRHVSFIEDISPAGGDRVTEMQPFQSNWLMLSDVCKHCENAPCVEACPTGALFYTEFGTVVVQQDVCNGVGYCVPACPFGVIAINKDDGKAHKCTLCYDRLKGGMEPACSKTCPTDSIQFGEMVDLHNIAQQRVKTLQELGVGDAYLYGVPDSPGATKDLGQLNAFFLLTERPEVYNLPTAPSRASRRVVPGFVYGLLTMLGVIGAAIAVLSGKGGGE